MKMRERKNNKILYLNRIKCIDIHIGVSLLKCKGKAEENVMKRR